MAYSPPPISHISKKIREYFNTHLVGADAFLAPNILNVIATVFALGIHPLYALLQYFMRQHFIHLCDDDFLLIHGAERGISRKSGSKSSGNVQIISIAGEFLSSGTILNRADGLKYVLNKNLTTTGDDIVSVTAENIGTDYNVASGSALSLNISNPSIINITVTDTGIGGGSLQEAIEEYRARLLDNIRGLRIAGTAETLRTIIRNEKNGVTRIFFDRPNQANFDVYFMMDNTYFDGIPLGADITEVQNILNQNVTIGLNPVVQTPIIQQIDVSVNVQTDLTPNVQTQVRQEITDYIIESGQVSTSLSGFSLNKEGIDQAIARGMSSTNFVVTSPTSNIAIDTGKIPRLGTVIFTVVP